MNEELEQTPEEPSAEQIQFKLPEGFVIVKENDLRALEHQAEKVTFPSKRGITKKAYNAQVAKAKRKQAKFSRRINRGK